MVSERTVAWIVMAVGTGQVLLLLGMLATFRRPGLPNRRFRPRMIERISATLGATMTALEAALDRFTSFVKDVVGQLTATKDVNAEQTGKIAELQAALDAALSDDAADKASIDALREEVATLQDEVAAKINETLDTLAHAPTVAPEVEGEEDEDEDGEAGEEAVVSVEDGPDGEVVVTEAEDTEDTQDVEATGGDTGPAVV